jgi:peptidoglycan/xylan/chitin deacetylase (PgdA/CDA1 family)
MSFSKVLMSVLFHSGLLTLFNWWVNRFRPRMTSEGSLVFPFIRRRCSGNVQILTYHRVNDEHDPYFPAVPPSIFARQMEYLVSRFFVCSLTEAVERLQARAVLDNMLVITFDDGYRDNYVHAFPVLRKFSIPATIFLATSSIGSGTPLWHERVFAAFRKTRESVLRGYGKDRRSYSLQTLTERLLAQQDVLRFLRSFDDHERVKWIDRLVADLKVDERKEMPDLMLSWDEVREMHQQGIFFGSHTVTHAILSKSSIETVKQEIYESQKIIAQELGVIPTTFAYPNGSPEDFTPEIEKILQDAGYICAVTTVFGANEPGQNLFELRRGGPWEEHLPTFAAKLNWYKFCTSPIEQSL